MHSCLSRPLLRWVFLSVCLLCCGVPLTLQCKGFGLSILMLFSLSHLKSILSIQTGVYMARHRDCHSLLQCFFLLSEHYDLEACCYIDLVKSWFLVSGQILAKLISRRQRRFDTGSVCLHEKYIGDISDYSEIVFCNRAG